MPFASAVFEGEKYLWQTKVRDDLASLADCEPLAPVVQQLRDDVEQGRSPRKALEILQKLQLDDAETMGQLRPIFALVSGVAGLHAEEEKNWGTAVSSWRRALAITQPCTILHYYFRTHLVIGLVRLGSLDDARKELTAAVDISGKMGEHFRRCAQSSHARICQFFHSLYAAASEAEDGDLLQALADVREWPDVVNDLAIVGAESPETIAKWRLYTALVEEKNIMDDYLRQDALRDAKLAPGSGLLIVLKGWSSTVPLIAKSVRRDADASPDVGGGHLLQWAEHGLCIDPGLGYVQNLHSVGGHVRDVDAVLTSHNHLDHTADLERLHNLSVEFGQPIDYFFDAGTHSKKPDSVDWGEKRPAIAGISGEARKSQGWRMISTGGRDLPFLLRVFDAIHPTADRPIGFRIDLLRDDEPKCSYGFTGDTEASADDEASMYRVLDDVDVLVLNFSKTDWNDLTGKGRIGHHLGYTGCARFIEMSEARLYLLSEWSAERGDMRFEVLHMLQAQFPDKQIMPADVGMMIATSAAKEAGDRKTRILCESCREWVSPADITALRPELRFGRIQYRCRYCLCGSKLRVK